jgi:flagellar hook-associated protein 3 FlgL
MGTRITTKILFNNAIDNLRRVETDLAKLQEQLASGLRVNRPSDDPIAARRAIGYRSLLRRNDHYLTAIRDAHIFTSATDSTMGIMTDDLLRVRELVLRGASGTLNQDQRNQIATEINEIINGMVDIANTTSGGRYLFGGSRTLDAPFEETVVGDEVVSVQYLGNDDELTVQVDIDAHITISQPGSTVFQGMIDVFDVLIGIRDDLRAGDTDSLSNVRLGELDQISSQVSQARAVYGSTINRLMFNEDRIEGNQITLQDVLSQTQEADFAEVVTKINMKEVALQAALATTSRVIQASLLDWL